MKLAYEDCKLYYRLYWSLLAYANQHYKMFPDVTTSEEMGRQRLEKVAKLRDALYDNPDLLERFLHDNPEHFSPQEIAIVAGWRHRISGDFYIIRYLKPYAVLMSTQDTSHLYGVLGLWEPIKTVLHEAPLPLFVKTTLLPFKDQIVYDGLMHVYAISFGSGIRSNTNMTYTRLKESEGIIEQLINSMGEAEICTNLAKKPPRKPAPDWLPAVEEMLTQLEKMRPTDTKLQGAALSLLRAAASLTQGALQKENADEEAVFRLRAVRTSLRKLENLLYTTYY